MTKTLGPVAAVLATASFAIAGGGEGDGPKGAKPNARTMDELASRATPQAQEGVMTDAKAGKGFTISKGDDFSINLANRIQVLYRYTALDDTPGTPGPDTSGFSIPRARTKLSGHVFDPRIQYQLQLDWASSSSRIKDAWARWVFYESDQKDYQIGVRFGQQKTRFGFEAEGTSGGLEHTDRSIASRTFAGVRSTGLWVEGAAKLGDGVGHWQVGAANGDTAGASSVLESGADNVANVDNELNYYLGLSFDPFGDMGGEGIGQSNYMQGDLDHSEEVMGRIGAGLMLGNHRNPAVGPIPANTLDIETTTINLNTAWKIQGVHVLGEFFTRTDDPDVTGATELDSTGFNIAASYTLEKPEGNGPQWGGGVRYSSINIDDVNPLLAGQPLGGGASGDVSELSFAINAYYHKHALKTQLGYTLQTIEPDGAGATDLDNHILDVFFQVMF